MQEASKASSPGKARERTGDLSSPHSVWTSFPDAVEAGKARLGAANGAGTAEAAAAREEMVSAASGMMAEASRLASDIVSAGA